MKKIMLVGVLVVLMVLVFSGCSIVGGNRSTVKPEKETGFVGQFLDRFRCSIVTVGWDDNENVRLGDTVSGNEGTYTIETNRWCNGKELTVHIGPNSDYEGDFPEDLTQYVNVENRFAHGEFECPLNVFQTYYGVVVYYGGNQIGNSYEGPTGDYARYFDCGEEYTLE